MAFPATRLRRLRAQAPLRALVRETGVAPRHLILPLFISERQTDDESLPDRQAISTMPEVDRLSVSAAVEEAEEASALGIGATMLFGLPAEKDELGSGAWDPAGIVQRAAEAIKRTVPGLLVVTDVCLCEYTSHGHCGVLSPSIEREGPLVDNDATLELLSRIAVSHLRAGVDAVAPSDMMDGRIAGIREGLDREGYVEAPIFAYSAKFGSAFYGPFREAVDCAPAFGDRRTYQMDPGNRQEAVREALLDIEEGTDVVMIKPALAYGDVIATVKHATGLPIAAYNVGGEYAMVKAAAEAGFLDERSAVLELLTCLRRAGADIIVTYHAKQAARWLAEQAS
jgi:porphobilinogen synthase